MAKTYGDIKTAIWGLLGQRSSSTIFSPTVVGNAANALCRRIFRGRLTSLLDENKIYSAGRLWINEGSTYIRFKLPTSLTQAFTVGQNILYCDTTNLVTAGFVELEGEIFQYTGKTSTTLTGVTGGTTNHSSGIPLVQLYQMPTGYERPFRVNRVQDSSISLGSQRVEVPFDEFGKKAAYYQIARSGIINLIRLVGFQSDDLIEFIYSKVYTPMVNDSDLCPLPDDYGETLIARIVAGQFAIEKGIPNGQNILLAGYAELQDFFRYFDNELYRVKHTIKPQSYSFRSVRR